MGQSGTLREIAKCNKWPRSLLNINNMMIPGGEELAAIKKALDVLDAKTGPAQDKAAFRFSRHNTHTNGYVWCTSTLAHGQKSKGFHNEE
eukprot:5319911-Amphidinium_carterae.1